jgi:hypothetical protein
LFCVDGCAKTGQTSSRDLNASLNALETTTGIDEINVIVEACHAGSFIDRVGDLAASLSKAGRVIVASTDRAHNAYASNDGAYFSDAFLSCIVDSGSLKTCYDQAVAAVALQNVGQAPWLDDNGDGVSDGKDGTIAQERYIATTLGGFRPILQETSVSVDGTTGTLAARVERGAQPLDLVWAAVYAPSFREPTTTTLKLDVPVVPLEKDPEQESLYRATYPNGFAEAGRYRVVFYTQDQAGAHAHPQRVTTGKYTIYLPLILKEHSESQKKQ